MTQTPNNSKPTNNKKHLLGICSITSVICAVYWQSLFLPFIQDDWALLRGFQTTDTWTMLKSIFSYENKLFYRPLAESYFLFMYKIFGPNPFVFHGIVLVIHTINSYLIARIFNILFNNWVPSYLIALVYAAAIAIHLDPLAWAVGIFDIAGAFFFFCSLWLFLNNKPIASAIIFLLGCLSKESLILLPLILFSYPFLMHTTNFLKETIQNHWKQALFFLPPIIIVAAIKLSGTSPFTFPPTHPYVIDLTGPHIIQNFQLYLTWMLQAFCPFFFAEEYPLQHISGSVALALLCGFFAISRLDKKELHIRHLLFLGLWLFIGLLPVIFLPNHTYRYYSTYALPAFIGMVLIFVRVLFLSLGAKEKAIKAVLISICSIAIIGSILQGNKIYKEGLYHITLGDGTNRLIMKAAFVDLLYNGLKQHVPNAPDNTTILTSGVNIWSFNKDSGPQFWYNNESIQLHPLSALQHKNGQLYIEHTTNILDPSKIFICQISNGQFIKRNLSDIRWGTY